MSAGDPRLRGDRHHVHLGEREFDRARNDPRFLAVLNRGFQVSYDYDVPYLGGYSQDGATIYVDRDTPEQIKRGKRVYVIRPAPGTISPGGLVRGICVHEHWEKTAMTAWGWGYAEAHELATHAENHFARDVLQDPAEYEDVWRPIIKLAERKLHAQAAQLPPDLDRTPYM
jgi:hypothetical protein